MGGTFGKSGSWVVDHSYDNLAMTDLRHGSISTISGGESDPPGYTDAMETPAEKKARKRSHIVAYTTMFVMSIGFSIVLSGVWPYLEELKPGIAKDKLGWVVAANPLGQMIASPLLGIWGNKMGSIRIPCLATVVFFILGNALYSVLGAFGDSSYWMMLVSRFIVGVSSANVTLCRSYLASSTTVKERTVGIAIIAAAQALGFVIGPGIQTILTLVIPGQTDIGNNIIIDKYTAAGWVAAALGLINLVILMPCIFQEHNIAEKEQALLQKNKSDVKLPNPDAIALTGILFGFFVTLFIYVLLETLATPFVMDQYGWNEDQAVVIIGIALSGGGLLSIFMFVLSGYLAKKFDERKIMFIVGFIPLIIGTFLYIPFTGDDIWLQQQCNRTLTTEMSTFTSTESTTAVQSELLNPVKSFLGAPISLLGMINTDYNYIIDKSLLKEMDNSDFKCSDEYVCACGCPVEDQPWCADIKALPIPQLITAYVITILGYPVAQSISQALFSKIVGPRPQGLWMGILTGVGSFSRIMGPIFVSYVYASLGTLWTFAILSGMMVIAGLELLIISKRLVPIKMIDDDHEKY